jgi:hypothetical protein
MNRTHSKVLDRKKSGRAATLGVARRASASRLAATSASSLKYAILFQLEPNQTATAIVVIQTTDMMRRFLTDICEKQPASQTPSVWLVQHTDE